MFNLGTPELLVILVVALLVLGPTKLPDAARKMGRAASEARRLTGGFQREMRAAMRDLEDEPSAEDGPRGQGTGARRREPPAG